MQDTARYASGYVYESSDIIAGGHSNDSTEDLLVTPNAFFKNCRAQSDVLVNTLKNDTIAVMLLNLRDPYEKFISTVHIEFVRKKEEIHIVKGGELLTVQTQNNALDVLLEPGEAIWISNYEERGMVDMEKLKIAVVGLGNRGQLFAEYVLDSADAELTAIADCNESAREKTQNEYKLAPQNCYESADEFFAQGKCADAVFICTQDSDHKAHTIKAMQLGYDVCLEKPIATKMQDCEDIYAAQQATGRKVMICHVLRYSHFYGKLRQMIKSGEIGDVVTISQTENVGYWHDAHSYVRGVWSNAEKSSPMILAKCCHDLDILFWLYGKRCKSVSSFGGLYYFKKENAPEGAAAYCVDCNPDTRKDCPYDAFKIYNDIYKAYNPILGNATVFRTSRKDFIDGVLSQKPNTYGKCVFACDNNVVDHQVVNMLFEDDRTAQLTMTAFSKDCHRNIKIHGTLGEIKGDMEENKIYVYPFRADDYVIDLTELADDFSVHGGGDKLLFEDFIAYLRGNESNETRTTLKDSLLSHKMSFAAEYSRLHGGIPVAIEEE